MHVLMISLDSSMLGNQRGNTVSRHQSYADRAGKLTVVTYNPIQQRKTPRRFAQNFSVHPVNAHPVLFPWRAYSVAAKLIRQQRPDVITTQDPFSTGVVGVLLKLRFGIPLDMQNHSSFFNNEVWLRERPLRNRALHTLGKLLVRFADTHRVLTPGEKAHYLAMNIPEERVAIQHTPTDVGLFAAPVNARQIAELRAALDIAPDAPVILWVGRPVGFKNVPLLLAAYRRVRAERPDARLVLVGDFVNRVNFVRSAEAAGVVFAGRVEHDDLTLYYHMADVYAHSSRYEGFGKVLVEALAAGTPVCATHADGPDVIVRHAETGLLCEHTPEALGDALLNLINDPDRAQAMGRAGQADVLERFDYERQLDAIVETFRNTIHIAGNKEA